MILVGDQGIEPCQHKGHGFTDQSASLAEYSPKIGMGARIWTQTNGFGDRYATDTSHPYGITDESRTRIIQNESLVS